MRMSLFWRVFLVNAALLIAGVLILALTPISISAEIRLIQAVVLAAGVAIVLVANLLLLRPMFAPLERLAHRMEELDVLRVLRPVPASSPGEIGALERAFNRMIERLEGERRQAGTRALQAREEERQRIARGLHDEVGQTMTGVLFLLKQLAQDAPASQRAPLDEAQEAIRTNLEEVRRIAQELRPEALDHLGLASAVNNLARAFARRTNVNIERRIDPHLGQLHPNVELVLYRVAQESLTNIARHSEATHVLLDLGRNSHSVVLRIADNGRGFDQPHVEGGGLRGIRENALIVGGALAIKPSASGGVEVRLEIPTRDGA
ncbi:MAG TPA: sensor histidine kinase [Gaiellaceae bacterium]|nr:sensor histidine kinase [Gaiellaceae bacterium]